MATKYKRTHQLMNIWFLVWKRWCDKPPRELVSRVMRLGGERVITSEPLRTTNHWNKGGADTARNKPLFMALERTNTYKYQGHIIVLRFTPFVTLYLR